MQTVLGCVCLGVWVCEYASLEGVSYEGKYGMVSDNGEWGAKRERVRLEVEWGVSAIIGGCQNEVLGRLGETSQTTVDVKKMEEWSNGGGE